MFAAFARREIRWMLTATFLSAIGRGLTLPFLLIYLAEVRDLPVALVGVAIGWMGVVSLATAPLGGILIDRYGARLVLLPVLLCQVVGTASLAWVGTIGQAVAALTVVGMAGSTQFAAVSTILASLAGEGERQRVFGFNFTLLNLGIGVGGLLAGWYVDLQRVATFQLLYLVDAATFLAPLLIVLLLRHIGGRVKAAPGAASGDAASGGPGGYAVLLRDRPYRRLVLLGMVLAVCGYAQIDVGFTAFASQVSQVTPRVIGWAFAANSVTIVVLQLFVLRWLEGRSRTRALAGVGVVWGVAWAILAVTGLADGGFALAAAGVVTCMVVFSMGETLFSPVMPALTNALAKPELRGRYNAVGTMTFGLSSVVGPLTAGPLIGSGLAVVWAGLTVGGCLLAAMLALGLRGHLTAEQDGRPVVGTPPAGTPPASTAAAGSASVDVSAVA
ncbi:MAG: MFS transporter [Micromonosporaceae bacterium]